MPAVTELITHDEGSNTHPEAIPLYLPSSVGTTVLSSLVGQEIRLRTAQADDALCELRRLLRILQGLRDYKYTQLGPSQRAGTRAQSLIARFVGKIDRCAERYSAAWAALTTLDPEGSWTRRLRELKKTDVRTVGKGAADESEGHREISWIWRTKGDEGTEASEEEMGEGKCAFKEHEVLISNNQ
jgi:hypothetical protein